MEGTIIAAAKTLETHMIEHWIRGDRCECHLFLPSNPSHLCRASKYLVTSADAGTDLVVLCLRVTETVEFRLNNRSVRRLERRRLWGGKKTHKRGHKGSSEPDGISLALVTDHVNLDTGRLHRGFSLRSGARKQGKQQTLCWLPLAFTLASSLRSTSCFRSRLSR